MPRATPQMSACSSSVQRVAKPTWRWECFRRSLAACTERRKLMREADRQSGETTCKTDVVITIATSSHRHRSSPSLSPPPSPSEITGPIGREEGGTNVNVMVVVIVVTAVPLPVSTSPTSLAPTPAPTLPPAPAPCALSTSVTIESLWIAGHKPKHFCVGDSQMRLPSRRMINHHHHRHRLAT